MFTTIVLVGGLFCVTAAQDVKHAIPLEESIVERLREITPSKADTKEPAIWKNSLAKDCRPLDRSIDLLFILDGSGSNAGEVFDTQMRMVNDLVDLIEVGPNHTRIAILQYSGWTRMELLFTDHETKPALKSAIKEITHFGGSTRTGRALDKALRVFTESDYGARLGRDDVAQVAVVVSDGRSIDDPSAAANRLRRAGVIVMTMGIGHNVFSPELEKISGGAELAFVNETMNDFLHTFKKIAIGEQCDYAKGPRGAEILCEKDSIIVNVKTDLPLLGHLYVSDYFGAPACTANARPDSAIDDERRVASLNIPLNECGMQKQFLFSPRGLLFETSVVLKYHPDYNSPVDQVFSVRCFYPDMRDETDDYPELNIDDTIVNTPHPASFSAPEMLMPCAYSVTNEEQDECMIDMTRVGQKITHKWQCDRAIFGTSYRILVHSCFMKNEKGKERMIVNEQGCSIDPHLIATPTYVGDLEATIAGTAVKFAESSMVKFKCSISFCRKDDGECHSMLPPRCNSEMEMVAKAAGASVPPDAPLRRRRRQIVRTDLHNLPSDMVNKLFARRNFFFNPNAGEEKTTTLRPLFTFPHSSSRRRETFTITHAPQTVDALVDPVSVASVRAAIPRVVTTPAPPQKVPTTPEVATPTAPPEVTAIRVDHDFAIDAPVETLDVIEGSGEEITIDKPKLRVDDMHLMGLSEMIVRRLNFNQVDLESQAFQVRDLRDTRMTGKSPVNWCPRNILI